MSAGRTAAEERYWREQKLLAAERDGGCRLAHWSSGPCFGALQPHHIWRRGQGGPDDADNIVWLCAGHHRHVHEHPAWAMERGLLRSGPPPV